MCTRRASIGSRSSGTQTMKRCRPHAPTWLSIALASSGVSTPAVT